MSRRWPLWTALLPLLVGAAVWALVWRGYAQGFEADLEKLLPAGAEIAIDGFPYRLEARIAPVRLVHRDTALEAALGARSVTVNRVPWQADRQVLNLVGSVAEIGLGPLEGARARIAAENAQASLRLDGSRIARLSAVWEEPRLTTGLFAAPMTAARFEAHLRETPSPDGAAGSASPRFPTQVQLVLEGDKLRFAEGDPLALKVDAELTAKGPVDSLARWQAGGTAEIRSARLGDGTGDVATMVATLVTDAAGRMRIAGTIETVCPATVRAMIAGLPPVSEKRLRKAERIAISGTLPGGVAAAARDPLKPAGPVRGQLPACPRLR